MKLRRNFPHLIEQMTKNEAILSLVVQTFDLKLVKDDIFYLKHVHRSLCVNGRVRGDFDR